MCRISGNRYWNLRKNFSPSRGRGLHYQPSADQSKPLAHSDEANSDVRVAVSNIKTRAGVDDPQLNFIIRVTKFDLGLLRSTMLNNVAQRFLGNPEEAQRHMLRDLRRNTLVGEFDPNPVLLADLFAKSHESGPKTHVLQFAGMELMGKAMNV